MSTRRVRVRSIRQTMSGADHVVYYEAVVSRAADVRVNLADGAAVTGDESLLRLALAAIEKGARRAVQDYDGGVALSITRVVLHPLDFRADAHERETAAAISDVIRAWELPAD